MSQQKLIALYMITEPDYGLNFYITNEDDKVQIASSAWPIPILLIKKMRYIMNTYDWVMNDKLLLHLCVAVIMQFIWGVFVWSKSINILYEQMCVGKVHILDPGQFVTEL